MLTYVANPLLVVVDAAILQHLDRVLSATMVCKLVVVLMSAPSTLQYCRVG